MGQERAFSSRAAIAFVAIAACAFAVGVGEAGARDGKDGRTEVRVTGVCTASATVKLRLRAEDGRLELQFEVEHARQGAWRVALVRERRVVWKGAATVTRASKSFEVERTVADLPGADTVVARAWGPAGAGCLATATLPGP